jgi:hypothetical protein
MSALGGASAAGAQACPYGVSQWVSAVSNTVGDPGTAPFISTGFAFPYALYSAPTSTQTGVQLTPQVIPDGFGRDWRGASVRAACVTAGALQSVAGTTMTAAGLARPSYGLSGVSSAGSRNIQLTLGSEDSGALVTFTDLALAASPIVAANQPLLTIPKLSKANSGWNCRVVYTANDALATSTGAENATHVLKLNGTFDLSSLPGAPVMLFSASWGGFPPVPDATTGVVGDAGTTTPQSLALAGGANSGFTCLFAGTTSLTLVGGPNVANPVLPNGTSIDITWAVTPSAPNGTLLVNVIAPFAGTATSLGVTTPTITTY